MAREKTIEAVLNAGLAGQPRPAQTRQMRRKKENSSLTQLAVSLSPEVLNLKGDQVKLGGDRSLRTKRQVSRQLSIDELNKLPMVAVIKTSFRRPWQIRQLVAKRSFGVSFPRNIPVADLVNLLKLAKTSLARTRQIHQLQGIKQTGFQLK